MFGKKNRYEIKDPAQIRALESPMRQEIVDAITAIGPCSITELASYLGRAADSLYFHVKKLVKVRLVQEVERRKEGRHESAIYAMPGRSARIVYSSPMKKSIRKVVAGALRLSLREFNLGLAEKNPTFSGTHRSLWGGRAKGWLSKDDLAEVNRLLEQLSQIMCRSEPGHDRQVYSLGWVFAPAQVRPRVKLANKTKVAHKKGR